MSSPPAGPAGPSAADPRSSGPRLTFPVVAGPSRQEMLPARLLPVLYIGWAHLCLLVAFAAPALAPGQFVGFFYHPRTMAVVHLVTLGWISASILGALYVISPLALRTPLPARRGDHAAFALMVVGTLGMAAHFWIDEFWGVAWSASLVVLALAFVAWRALPGLLRAPIQGGVKAHIAFAFLNILGAGVLGLLLAIDKKHGILGGSALSNLFAHVHLAALGWAAMMVLGVGYRMMPMILPSAMPQGRSLYASAFLLEAGSLGLFVCFLAESAWVPLFAVVAAGGFAAFLGQVAWMTRHPRPAPSSLERPDYGAWTVAAAIAYLGLAAILGLVLCFAPISEFTLAPAAAYGVLGLVGFLSQMVVGVEIRLLPMFAGTHAIYNAGPRAIPVTPYQMPARRLLAGAFWLWVAGVPALAAGVGFDLSSLIGAGGWLLLAAAALGSLNTARVLRHVFLAPRAAAAAQPPAPIATSSRITPTRG